MSKPVGATIVTAMLVGGLLLAYRLASSIASQLVASGASIAFSSVMGWGFAICLALWCTLTSIRYLRR